MNVNATEPILAHRFQLDHAPPFVTRTASRAPIVFTHLKSGHAMRGRSLAVPREEAFAFQVPLSAPFFPEVWVATYLDHLPRSCEPHNVGIRAQTCAPDFCNDQTLDE
jgi:hypothetical protein